jgi:hypothetical protein
MHAIREHNVSWKFEIRVGSFVKQNGMHKLLGFGIEQIKNKNRILSFREGEFNSVGYFRGFTQTLGKYQDDSANFSLVVSRSNTCSNILIKQYYSEKTQWSK